MKFSFGLSAATVTLSYCWVKISEFFFSVSCYNVNDDGQNRSSVSVSPLVAAITPNKSPESI